MGLPSWATLNRPFGTQFVSRVLTQALKAVPFKILSFSAACEAVALLKRLFHENGLATRLHPQSTARLGWVWIYEASNPP